HNDCAGHVSASRIHQDIDCLMHFENFRLGRFKLVRLKHICLNEHRPVSGFLDLLQNSVTIFLLSSEDYYMSPGLCQANCHCASKDARAAGDNYNLTGDVK